MAVGCGGGYVPGLLRGVPRLPRLRPLLGWAFCLSTVALVLAAASFDVFALRPDTAARLAGHYAYLTLAVPLAVAGAMIVARRPGNIIGALLLVDGLGIAGDQFTRNYLLYCREDRLPTVWLLGWLCNWLWLIPPAVLLFGLMLYPDGRLPSRRWRPMATLLWVWSAVVAALAVLGAGNYSGPAPYPPAAIPGPTGRTLAGLLHLAFMLFPVLLAGAAASAVVRFRRARGVERAQLKWLAYAGSLVAVLWLIPAVHQLGTWPRAGANVALWTLPAAIVTAVLRHRLYQIDQVISRTLLYASLTVCVAGIYVILIGSFGALLEQQSGLAMAITASAVVAVVFAPLRDRLQRAIDRLLYGQRSEPFAVVSRLGRQLEAAIPPDQVLPTIVGTVAAALKVPYVAIELRRAASYAPVCVHGDPLGDTVEFGFTHLGEPLGRLVLCPRAPGETFSVADRELLGDLARRAGLAVHTVRLTDALQQSREGLVAAREEERHRLRRDLHDGLGSTLAGIAFRIEAMTRILPGPPHVAAGLLSTVKADVKQSVAEVRRLVDGLRPLALDEFGLAEAIRRHGAWARGPDGAALPEAMPLQLDVYAPDRIPPLPAAVEVAAYRIATEAVTNVLRHADARHCAVHIRADDTLELDITDDGRGLAGSGSSGFGLHSMRERAAEVGGTCVIESEAGTRVRVSLPISHPEQP